MSISQISPVVAKPKNALEELQAFIAERRDARGVVSDLERFEREAHQRFAAAEAAFIGEELARFDIDSSVVEINGVEHQRVLRSHQTYMTAAGPIRVERTLYSTRDRGDRAVAAMDLRAGVVEGQFTPLAAQHAAWAVAHLTPQESETLFDRLGGMCPSKASLDRLPKALSAQWEKKRPEFEKALRNEQKVPKEAVTVGVSLDGVLIPMKDGKRDEKRQAQRAEGKVTKGPTGYSEASCATLTYYDGKGEPLQTTRFARMPEKDKLTLKEQLSQELDRALEQRPDLRVVKIADGAKNNWTYLKTLPDGRKGEEVLDFFHGAEHLYDALAAAHGETSPKCQSEFVKYRHILRHDSDGVEKVIRHLRYLYGLHPRSKTLRKELRYFRRNRDRMHYASFHRRHLPIGSGIVEAACKTLVSQRLKRSGMRWREPGGQAILTLRALEQSGRFDSGWRLLVSCYQGDVRLPKNVIDFKSRCNA
jgi:hypothetical protein